VPVEALTNGWDPRNQQPVFIDYSNQFQGTGNGTAGTTVTASRGRGASGGTRKRSGSGSGKKKAKGRTKRGGGAGKWTTRADGSRAFVTPGGQQLSGAAAYVAYKGKKQRGGAKRGRRK